MSYSSTIVVRAQPDDVWARLVDVERWPHLSDAVQEARVLEGGSLRVGSTVILGRMRMRRFRYRVTDLVDGRSFAWRNDAFGVRTIEEYRIERSDTMTSFTFSTRLTGPLSRPLEALFNRTSAPLLYDAMLVAFGRGIEAAVSSRGIAHGGEPR